LRILRSTVNGEVVASPSKSYTHRAFVIGAMTGGKFEVFKPLASEDTEATLSALALMGAEIEKTNVSVKIGCPRLSSAKSAIDAKNSGTTLRLISGLAALQEGRSEITGDESLRKRPMKQLLNALRELGADCSGAGEEELPPIKIRGPMEGTSAKIAGNVSSQFISALLIACPMKKTPTKIKINGAMKSKSYIDISLHMLKRFRVEIDRTPNGFEMRGKQRPVGSKFEVPGDFSSASFLLCAAAITGGEVTVKGLNLSSPQGDAAVLEVLRRYGAEIDVGDNHVRCRGTEHNPFEFDVNDTPDLFPILSVLAATAKGESRLFGGEHLRFKESDRISTTVAMLENLGVTAEAMKDGCVIRGKGSIKGGNVDTETDHRIMMSATIAGLISEQGVLVNDESSFKISYPNFLEDVQKLGGIIQLVIR